MADTLGQAPYAATRNPFNYDKIEQTARDITSSWLTTTEIDDQLNLFGDTSQNTMLARYDLMTRMAIENYLGIPFFSMSYKVYYGVDSLYASPISLDLPEVSQGGTTIDSVQYYDGNSPSVLQTISSSNYYYDTTGNKVIIPGGMPSNVSMNRTSPLVVNYTLTGSPLKDYPDIRHAGLLLLTHFYNNRSDTTEFEKVKLPNGMDSLLRLYKPLVM